MTVKEALDKIYAPKGLTSVIEGLINNDFSVLDNQKGTEASFDFANLKIKELQIQLDNCHSDWSWWSILGDLEYWKAAKNILEAGMIHGGELADVEAASRCLGSGCARVAAVCREHLVWQGHNQLGHGPGQNRER